MGLLTSGAGTVAGLTGHDDAHTAMELFSGKQGAYELKASMVDTNGFTRAVSKVGGAAPSLIPALTVGRFAGWAGKFVGLSPQATQTLAMLVSSITAGGQSFGSVYHEAHEAYVDAGMAEKEARRAALKPAIIGGLITAAMTQAGGANGVEAVFRGAGARELVKRTLWERAKMVGIDMTEEALEEGTDQLLQGIVGSFNHRRDLTREQILDGAVEAAWIGGLLGGTVSGVQEGSRALWDKDGKLHEAVTGANGGGNHAEAEQPTEVLNDGSKDQAVPIATANGRTETTSELSNTDVPFSHDSADAGPRAEEEGGRNAGDSLLAARDVASGDRGSVREESPSQVIRGSGEQRNEQFQRIVQWARTSGELFNPARLGKQLDEGGEHAVHSAADQPGKVYKATSPGYAGLTRIAHQRQDGVRVTEDDALPNEYLDRWAIHNEVFGSDVTLEGVLETPQGPRLVVSQRLLKGSIPSVPQVHKHLASELKFVPTGDGHWYRAADDVALADTKPANFIVDEKGQVLAVDVITFRPTAAMRKVWRLPNTTAVGLPEQSQHQAGQTSQLEAQDSGGTGEAGNQARSLLLSGPELDATASNFRAPSSLPDLKQKVEELKANRKRAPSDGFDGAPFRGTGRLTGIQLTEGMFSAIDKRLAEITPVGEQPWRLVRNDDAYLKSKKARAGFNPVTGQLHLRADATYFDYFHELCHALQRAQLGLEAYQKLRQYDREMFVFDQIARYDFRFTEEEIDVAIEDALHYYYKCGPGTYQYIIGQ